MHLEASATSAIWEILEGLHSKGREAIGASTKTIDLLD